MDKIQIAINRLKEELKVFYMKYVKPLLDMLKNLFKVYIDVPSKAKYKPVKRIWPKMNIVFYKPRMVHCRNNC